jgi:hypothetical protein
MVDCEYNPNKKILKSEGLLNPIKIKIDGPVKSPSKFLYDGHIHGNLDFHVSSESVSGPGFAGKILRRND